MEQVNIKENRPFVQIQWKVGRAVNFGFFVIQKKFNAYVQK